MYWLVCWGFLYIYIYKNAKQIRNFHSQRNNLISSFMLLFWRKYCKKKQKTYLNSVAQYTTGWYSDAKMM